jgi:hypothetical protein
MRWQNSSAGGLTLSLRRRGERVHLKVSACPVQMSSGWPRVPWLVLRGCDCLAGAGTRLHSQLYQLCHTTISVRTANAYTEVDLKRFSGYRSLRSLERYMAENREVAQRKTRELEH